MWMPTHAQVIVHRASGLRIKGKDNTNNAFVQIALAKTKYQTSVKEKAPPDVEWHEECELPIPEKGNTAQIVLTAFHKTNLGMDTFLGRVTIPLQDLDIYERPKNKWYLLEDKAGNIVEEKKRGRLEVKIGFIVKSGSLTDLDKKGKHKSSLQSLGASLLSLGSVEKKKSLRSLSKLMGKKKNRKSSLSINSDLQEDVKESHQGSVGNADPGVGSDDEFMLDELSQKGSSTSSLNIPQHVEPKKTDEWQSKLVPQKFTSSSSLNLKSSPVETPVKQKPVKDEWESKLAKKQTTPNHEPIPKITISPDSDRKKDTPKKAFIINNNSSKTTDLAHLPNELLNRFEGKSREELIVNVCKLEKDLAMQRKKMQEMEDYLDDLLLRVMETTPGILQNPFKYKLQRK